MAFIQFLDSQKLNVGKKKVILRTKKIAQSSVEEQSNFSQAEPFLRKLCFLHVFKLCDFWKVEKILQTLLSDVVSPCWQAFLT